MGHFGYGSPATSVEFDDRMLAHLKVVIAAKLRRGEAFMFTWEYETSAGSGHSSVWLHPSIPMQFDFDGSTEPTINRIWLEELMRSSNSSGGLRALLEPTTSADARGSGASPTSAAPAEVTRLSTARVSRISQLKRSQHAPVA